MRKALILICMIGIVLSGLSSCKMISSFLHDAEIAARVNDHLLYRNEVISHIPPGIPAEDSLKMAQQYINSWASETVYLDIAEQQLSGEEKNVEKELEEYRRSLLKYRYEQRYINERLDTNVTDEQVLEYYESHKDYLKLRFPIVRVRYMRISPDNPELDVLKKKIKAAKPEAIDELDSLANRYAEKYINTGDGWMDVVSLAREFGEDYGSLMVKVKNSIIEAEDSYGKINIAYILENKGVGQIPPVEYCRARIVDIILSTRKQELMATLERDLLDEALRNGKLVIYQ